MADLSSILTDPNYVNANVATKQAIFDKFSANDTNFTKANSATQDAIRVKFGLTVAPTSDKKIGVLDLLSMPAEMGMALANKPRAEQAAFIAPAIEALGAGGGATLGSMGGPAGTVLGAGTGYAAAKELMRHVAGTAAPETVPQATQRVAQNALEGATMEAGGRAIVGPVLDKAAKAAGWMWDAVGGNLIQVRAGKIIRQIAGADVGKVKDLAANAAPELTAAQATAPAGVNTLAALGERAAKNDTSNFFSRTAAEQEAARAATLKANTPDMATAVAMRANAAGPLYTAARQPTTKIDTAPLVQSVDDLLSRNPGNPELVATLNKVKTGLEASQNAEQVSSVLDGLKTAIASKDNKFIVKNLLNVKSSIESSLPGYSAAQKVFAVGSPPVNQSAILSEMQNVMAREGGGERVVPFLNVLGRGENALIKRATGEPRFGGLEDALSPTQMKVVNDIAAQYTRDLQLAKSATEGQGGLSRILGENKSNVELPPALNWFTRTTNKVLSLLEGRVNESTMLALEKGMRGGKDLTVLLNALPTVERTNVLNALATSNKNFGSAATFGANALNSDNKNALRGQ